MLLLLSFENKNLLCSLKLSNIDFQERERERLFEELNKSCYAKQNKKLNLHKIIDDIVLSGGRIYGDLIFIIIEIESINSFLFNLKAIISIYISIETENKRE